MQGKFMEKVQEELSLLKLKIKVDSSNPGKLMIKISGKYQCSTVSEIRKLNQFIADNNM